MRDDSRAGKSGGLADITIIDDFLDQTAQSMVREELHRRGWDFGWKSKSASDTFAFWHQHFAGARQSDHSDGAAREEPYDCAGELAEKVPLLHELWRLLAQGQLAGHQLVRCYANAAPFGAEGTLHTDSVAPNGFTTIYYPHEKWTPDWGGETVFFNADKSDIRQSVYPKANRLLIFRGTLPHVARGVSRTCPLLRVTLMFKTEAPDD